MANVKATVLSRFYYVTKRRDRIAQTIPNFFISVDPFPAISNQCHCDAISVFARSWRARIGFYEYYVKIVIRTC